MFKFIKKITKNDVMILIFFGIVVKALGFVKTILIAGKYGLSSESDVFYLALSVVIILTSFIGGALNQSTIPVLGDIEAKSGKEGKQKYVNNLVSFFVLISIVVIILLIFICPFIIHFMTRTVGKFTDEQYNLTILLVRIGLPSILIYNVTGIYRGYLQSEKIFFDTALSDLPFNIIYIIFLLFMSQYFSIKALMIVHLIALSSQLLLQKISLAKIKFKRVWTFDTKELRMRQLATVIVPIFLSLAVNDINLMLDKMFASASVEGAITALEYGNKVNILILQVFISALSIVIFPSITKAFHAENRDKALKIIDKGIVMVLAFVLPITFYILIMRFPVIQVMYQRGSFDYNASVMTSNTMFFYSMGLLASSVKTVLNKLFYAIQETRITFITSVLSAILNVIFNIIFMQLFSYSGLALATSLASTLTMFYLFYRSEKLGWNFNYKKLLNTSIKIVIACIPMIATLLIFKTHFLIYFTHSKLLTILVLLALGGVSFFVYLLLFLKLHRKSFKDFLRYIGL